MEGWSIIDKLELRVEDVTSLNSKLVLLIGPPRSGKTDLLVRLSERRRAGILNVGATLGRQLLAVPSARRHLQAADLLKDLVDKAAIHGLLLLDNIELLFDRTLQLSPLELMKRHARARCVIAVWPGELGEARLFYAATGHSEHQNYGCDGLVPFIVH